MKKEKDVLNDRAFIDKVLRNAMATIAIFYISRKIRAWAKS